MLEVRVDHLGDVQFEVKARGHRIYCDQPAEDGGFDEGMTPSEFLLASLGTCAGYYAVQYLKSNRLPLDGLQIQVRAERASKPSRIAEFKIELHYERMLEGKHRVGMLESVHKCLIHNTLLNPPRIEVSLASSPEARPVLAA